MFKGIYLSGSFHACAIDKIETPNGIDETFQ
jgi:hypothetical protein